MKRIAFLINSTISKKNKKLKAIEKAFTKDLFETKYYFSEKPRHIEQLTQQAIADAFEYIILVGGDGTLNEGLNGVLESVRQAKNYEISDFDFNAIKHIKLGVLPSGSGNDFAKTIQTSNTIESLKTKILSDSFAFIDIGFAKYTDTENNKNARFFINITDVGMGGIIAQKVTNKNQAFNADFIYLKAILLTFLSYKNTKVQFTSEKESWVSNIMSLVFANGRFFGSGLCVAPDASITDGLLNIVKLGNITIWDYIKHLGDIRKGKFIKHKEVSYSQAKKLKVEPLDKDKLLIDMDGEFIGYAPLEIECVPNAIQVIF